MTATPPVVTALAATAMAQRLEDVDWVSDLWSAVRWRPATMSRA